MFVGGVKVERVAPYLYTVLFIESIRKAPTGPI